MKRRIAKNTTALFATRIINQVAGFLLVVYASRRLGVEDFGKYSFVVAFYLVFELISFFGLQNFLPREIGRRREEAGKYFVHAAALVGAVALVLVAAMNGVAAVYGLGRDTYLAAVVASFALLPASLGAAAESTFIGIERAEFITLLTFVKRTLVTGISVFVLWLGHGVIALLIVRAAVEFASASLSVPLCLWQTRGGGVRLDVVFVRRLLRGAMPFAALAVLASIYWRLDVLLLQRLVGPAEVGIYSASYRLMFLLTLVPESFMNAVYPNLARTWREDRGQFVRLAERSLRYLVAFALPAAVGAYVLAEPVVLLIYEVDFARSVAVFSLLIFAVVPIYVNNVFYRALFAAEQQMKSVLILVVNIVVMTAGGLVLIPRWHAVGAAAALLISLVAAFVQNYLFTFALVYRSRLGGAALRTAGAAAIMGLAAWALRPYVPWPPLILIGACLYVPLLFVLHVLGGEDVAAIREILGFGLGDRGRASTDEDK
ncbi:MAG: oligosaccharide flippase family protein [candidate division Zixibacteria bacterium]|nr:oligosaccharide flippase family protein [candidate division Zixibacteria bacterium]